MAFTTSYKMLFRKGGSSHSTLAIALLVAIISSTSSITNYLNLQAESLTNLVNPAGAYIILGGNSTAVTDSWIGVGLAEEIRSLSFVKHVFPQKMLAANITVNSNTYTIQVRGVDDVGVFLKARGAYLNGVAAGSLMEACVGEIAAGTLSIGLGDEVGLTVGAGQAKVRVVGVFRSQTQCDAELIVPMETVNTLTGSNETVSLIEFTLKEDVNLREALSQIMQLLPGNVKLIQTQQMKEFTQQMNMQTIAFLNVLSIAVYAVVAAASYVIATRLITESSYELAMLRAIGSKKRLILTLVLTQTTAIALLGSILGVALGTAGAQTASTMLRWIQPSVDITPFLKPEQALQALILTLTSSFLGCIYPALKSTRTRYVEQPL